ncbi:MAG: acetate--CoA ligase family protein, partial [Geminicoccaceae bacterium]
MSVRNLDVLFNPGSSALIGASRTPRSVGAVPARYRRNQEMLHQVPPSVPDAFRPDPDRAAAVIERAANERRDWLFEAEAKDVLDAYGIPVVPTRVVSTPDE